MGSRQLLGYSMAIALVIAVTIDQIAIKRSIGKLQVRNIAYRGIFTTPLMLTLGLITYHFDKRCIPVLIIYIILEYYNMILSNKSMNKLSLPIYSAISNA